MQLERNQVGREDLKRVGEVLNISRQSLLNPRHKWSTDP